MNGLYLQRRWDDGWFSRQRRKVELYVRGGNSTILVNIILELDNGDWML